MRHVLTIAVGSCLLAGCLYQPRVNMLSCVGTGPIRLRGEVIDKMTRDELSSYLKYKTWWKQNCKPQEDYSVHAFEGLSTLR